MNCALKIKLFALVALLCLTVQGQGLYVGTYNIRYENQGDYKKGNGWKQRCPVVCAQINFQHPDVLGTQEVLAEQLDDMKALLTDYDYIGVGRDDGKRKGEHTVIFYDRNAVKLQEQGHFWLSETPDRPGLGWDAACTRICTWGKFRSKRWKKTFYFFNLHMDHVGIVARRESAKLVVNRIKEIAKGAPVILTGDFNVDQNDTIYSIFTTSGLLNDSYEHSKQRFAENGTFNGFNPDRKTDSRIDHIFVSPSFHVMRYGILTDCYWTDQERRLPSDHYPVFVRLE